MQNLFSILGNLKVLYEKYIFVRLFVQHQCIKYAFNRVSLNMEIGFDSLGFYGRYFASQMFLDCVNFRVELRKYTVHFLTHHRLKKRLLIELGFRECDCSQERKVVNGIGILFVWYFFHCYFKHFIIFVFVILWPYWNSILFCFWLISFQWFLNCDILFFSSIFW